MISQSLSIVCIAADLKPGALGGAEVAAVETIKRLSKKHQLVVFTGNDTSIRSLLPKSVTVIPVYYPRIPNLMGLSYVLIGTPQIAWNLSRRRLDLLWAKQEFPQAIVGVIIKKLVKKPLYVTIQNPRMHEEELVLTRGGSFFKKLMPKLLTPLLSWSYAQADVLAAVSAYSATETKKTGGKRVVVIPNGVNVKEFEIRSDMKKNKIGNSIFTIVSTSSLIPRNGMDTLIEAVALLPEELKWRLIIAGEGQERKNLKRQISNLKLDKQISLLGRVENKQIPELLAQAHLFVRPSRFEGFGVAFIEAMAAGVPVIATPVGGIPDFITHRETGLLVEPNDPKQLALAIEKLFNETELKQSLIKKAQKLVKDQYSWDSIANKVESEMCSLATNH